MYRGLSAAQAQCPPQPYWFVQGTGCVGYLGNGGDNANPLPPATVYSSADAWTQYNQYMAGVQQTAAYDTQKVMPKLLMYGGAAAAILLLAPGGWKLTAIAPAFIAYLTYSLKGGL